MPASAPLRCLLLLVASGALALGGCGPPLVHYDTRIDSECDTLDRCRALHEEIRRVQERCDSIETCEYSKYLKGRILRKLRALKQDQES